jgi:hypothetical protein
MGVGRVGRHGRNCGKLWETVGTCDKGEKCEKI